MKHLLLFFFTLPAFCESLTYNINWPSGLSLGQAQLASEHTENSDWHLSLDVDASIPGFTVRDQDRSIATPDLCSTEFDKTFLHGSHQNDERLTFDQGAHSVTRETTNGGGKSQTTIGACARDPLAFIQFLRRELAEGRLPSQEQVVYGALYDVRVEYTGARSIQLGEQKVEADRITASIKGPSSNVTVEIFFSHDKLKTPLLAKVPMALGTFSIELQK
jgi:Protein of unknown function (DUF3108)